ncbi:hypothetical protein ACFL54_01070 [Planctomycetota bacterium]
MSGVFGYLKVAENRECIAHGHILESQDDLFIRTNVAVSCCNN